MEIIKIFNESNQNTEIIIKGTYDEPLFRSSDIGSMLDISSINTLIKDFNETEKVMIPIQTLGGIQQISFLTEKGLYNILFISRKPIAKNWICNVIKEIRLQGKYELEKKLEEKENLILKSQEKIEELKLMNKKLLIDSNNMIVFYIFNIDYRNSITELTIGFTENYHEIIKSYKEIYKYGKLEFIEAVPEYINLEIFENYIFDLLSQYRKGENIFELDVLTVKYTILNQLNIYKLLKLPNPLEIKYKIQKINDSNDSIINNVYEKS